MVQDNIVFREWKSVIAEPKELIRITEIEGAFWIRSP
jgi:hypothetical protein